jgi:hypothetical protein
MSKARKSTIEVQGAAITVLSQKEGDFIRIEPRPFIPPPAS